MEKRDLISILEEEFRNFKLKAEKERVGEVVEVADGIAKVAGLSSCLYLEMLEFPKGIYGLAMNLEEDLIGTVIFGDFTQIKEGDKVKSTGKVLEVPVGEALLSRVVNPLGQPIDGRGDIKAKNFSVVEKIAPKVIEREPVNTPLQTGIKVVDALVPIGRGQRELIIGDRGCGKTALALDAILNQKDQGVYCIYVAIGQKQSKVAKLVEKLKVLGALDYTTVVCAFASDPVSFWYLAPYSGCAMGEYFRDKGKDALVIYDDLSKHAWAYRQISLLLKRPAGREAYPGDIFYLHSRLLERAAKLNKAHGGGSLTALPIIETQAGDISAYIPTNVISITDGQIYLEADLFNAGIRPALNVGLSVSRVGGAAQIKAMKKVASKLRLDLAQYREIATFAQFATDLDESTRRQIERGKLLTEVLKQKQWEPLSVAEQVIILTAVNSGMLDDIKLDKFNQFEKGLYQYIRARHKEILKEIETKKDLEESLEGKIKKAVEEYKNMKEEYVQPRSVEEKA